MKANEDNHNYMRDKKNNHRIIAEEKEISLKNQAERKMNNESKYGKVKFANLIIIGERDRIGGIPPQNIDSEDKKIPYSYGYFEKGSRTLEGKFASGTFDESSQRKFGILDFIHKIPEVYIASLKRYPSYLEGRIYQMGKKAYDDCIENNLSIEEYSQIMEILYPEIKSSSFKEGYEAREKELQNIKPKHK